MSAKKTTARTECGVDGCTNPARRKGVCKEHLEENYVGGCTVDGCTEEQFCKGRCKAHYMRLYRRKNGDTSPPLDAPVRAYGQARFDVFTRIPEEAAAVILKASGRRDGMYEQAQKILTEWAEQNAA